MARLPTVGSAAGSAARRPTHDGSALGAAFYDRPVVEVAQALIGCVLRVGECAGVIVETEAYHDSEPACHAFVGLTPRTATLFGPPGRAYVYFSYGVHALLNAVCEPPSVGAAVLIRALEPLAGLESMAARRGVELGGTRALRALCSGPGKLTQALGVSLPDNGSDLACGPVVISARSAEAGAGVGVGGEQPAPPAIVAGRRIGITKAVELPWRFCAAGSPFLSAPVREAAGRERG